MTSVEAHGVCSLHVTLKLVDIKALLSRVHFGDSAFLNHTCKLLIEAYHSVLPTCLDSGLDKVYLIVTDHCLDGVGSVEDLKCCYSACSVSLGDKGLGDDTYENRCKLCTDLVLLMSGECVDDTVNGIRRRCGVKWTPSC